MTAVYFGGMAATVVLTFGVYGTLDSVWGPPMSSLATEKGGVALLKHLMHQLLFVSSSA